MVEQRLDARWTLQRPAVFVTRAWGRVPCVIQDFCAGGALLAFREPDTAEHLSIKRGEGLVIQMRGALATGSALHGMRCRIAHRGPGLVGVAFINPETAVLKALAQEAKVPNFHVPLSEAGWAIADRLHALTLSFFQERFVIFNAAVLARLGVAVQSVRSQREQQQWRQALQLFQSEQDSFQRWFEQAFQAALSRFCSGGAMPLEDGDISELALIDQIEFEDWLALKVMASRVESRLLHELNILQLRLSALSESPEPKHPFTPSVLCDAFLRALRKLRPAVISEKAFYKAFEETLLGHLKGLYQQLNAELDRAGVCPELSALPSPEVEEQKPVQATPLPESTATELVAKVQTADDLLKLWQRPQPPAIAHFKRGSEQGLLALWLAVQDGPAALLLESAEQQGWDEWLRGVPAPLDEEGFTWRQRLELLASVQRRTLPGAVRLAAYLVDTWFTALCDQHRSGQSLRQHLHALARPALRLLCVDHAPLHQSRHPLRQVLDAVVSLQDEALEPAVLELWQQLDTTPATASSYGDIARGLDERLAQLELRRRLQFDRLLRHAAGDWRQAQARSRVDEGLNRRMAGRTLPEVLQRFTQAWRSYMELAELRCGADSPEALEAWQVVDDLLSLVRDPDYRVEWTQLLPVVKQGFARLGSKGPEQQEAVAALKRLVAYAQAPAREELVMVTLPLQKPPQDDEPEKRWLEKWLERVDRMQRGDMLQLKHKGGDTEHLQLIWIADDLGRYVFADDAARQAQSFSRLELAALLRNGHALLAEPQAVPPSEAALEHALQHLYQELIWQATHDALTGLVNRQTFARQVELAVDRAKRQRARHVLAEINVDQFGIFNRDAGPDAGDRFLQEVAHLLAKPLKAHSTVARLSGDTFGMLLEDCDLGEAQQLLSLRLAELSAYPFRMDGREFHLSASAGLVDISYTSDSFGALLQAAETACAIAKEQGGNRIQIYHPDNVEMARRDGVMTWITKLNQALEQERLQLRCQLIRAVNPERAAAELPHYEILLGMQGADGEQLPPEAFVQAAERYNRMQAVDRWVIDNTLRWLAANPEPLARLGQVSINLSGHSLNDAHLLEFIVERLAHWKIEPQKICFEVTETTAIANLADAADLIRELKKCGCRFALDDFGVGQSSYHYLKHLPVDYVKIDGAFIRDLARNPHDDMIVRSINEMAHIMGRETIAEYVEDDDILQRLAEIGVDYAQGYGIERPRWLASLA